MKLATLVKMGEKYLKAFPTPTTAFIAREFGGVEPEYRKSKGKWHI